VNWAKLTRTLKPELTHAPGSRARRGELRPPYLRRRCTSPVAAAPTSPPWSSSRVKSAAQCVGADSGSESCAAERGRHKGKPLNDLREVQLETDGSLPYSLACSISCSVWPPNDLLWRWMLLKFHTGNLPCILPICMNSACLSVWTELLFSLNTLIILYSPKSICF
jgi:hypothetical protein